MYVLYKAGDIASAAPLERLIKYISTLYSRYKKMLMTCSIPRPVRLKRADLEVMLCTLKQQLDLFVPVRSITAHAGKRQIFFPDVHVCGV